MLTPNLDKAAGCAAVLTNVIDKMDHEGSLLTKVGTLLELEPAIPDLLTIDFSAAKAELKALDNAAVQDIEAAFKAKLSMVNPNLQGKVVAGMDLAVELAGNVQAIIAFVKSLKA